MKYTENYHLPQWDETDRIMHTDFNRMCADLEAGMTENARTAEDVRQGGEALDKKTLDRLRRLAYNHYCTVQDMEPFPWQVGVFHQNPAKDKTNVTGTMLWNKVCFTGKGESFTAADGLYQYAKQLTSMKVVKDDLEASSPLTVSFYIPGPAYMSRIDLTGTVSNNVPNTPAPVRLTLTNQDTGEIEVEHQLNIAQSVVNAAIANQFVDVFLPLHAGQHYLLKLEPLAAVFDAELHLYTNTTQTPLYAISSRLPITATHTMREAVGSSCGLLIVRGLVYGPNGTLTVKWDGKEVPLQKTRMVQISDGRYVREMVYYRDEPIPAETTFELQYDPKEQGEFLFYDWGAVLL